MSGRVIAGIGCRRGCPAEDIAALVAEANARAGRTASALAAPWFKMEELGLCEAARALGVPLLRVGPRELAEAETRCVTRSEIARRWVGFGAIAECAALAVAGSGGRLILARIAGPRTTCALAVDGDE